MKFWWDQELDELKHKSTVSHKEWTAANRPNSGIISDTRKKDKYAYRNLIRQRKKSDAQSVSNSLHDALINKNQSSFWKIWKSKLSSQSTLPKIIDGLTCKKDISNLFAKKLAEACSCNSEKQKIRN